MLRKCVFSCREIVIHCWIEVFTHLCKAYSTLIKSIISEARLSQFKFRSYFLLIDPGRNFTFLCNLTFSSIKEDNSTNLSLSIHYVRINIPKVCNTITGIYSTIYVGYYYPCLIQSHVDKLGESSGIGVERKDEILGKLSQGTHILEYLRNGSTLQKMHVTILCELNFKKRVSPEGKRKLLIF